MQRYFKAKREYEEMVWKKESFRDKSNDSGRQCYDNCRWLCCDVLDGIDHEKTRDSGFRFKKMRLYCVHEKNISRCPDGCGGNNRIFHGSPEIVNKNNNCPFYEKRVGD